MRFRGFAVSNEVSVREHVLPGDYLVALHFQFRIDGGDLINAMS